MVGTIVMFGMVDMIVETEVDKISGKYDFKFIFSQNKDSHAGPTSVFATKNPTIVFFRTNRLCG